MQLRIDWKYVAAFFALNGVIGELHKQAHIMTNRIAATALSWRWLRALEAGPLTP